MRPAIIIPCYNYGRFLSEAIESALAQTQPAAQVIVVDDGSTDNSLEIARSYGVQVQQRPHAGTSAAKAAGICATDCDCFTILDADDNLAPNYLEETVPILESDPRVALVYTPMTLFGAAEGVVPARPFSLARLMGANYIHGSSLTRRTAYDETEGYANIQCVKYEDWHLFLTIAERGWRATPARSTMLYYRQHSTSRNRTAGEDHELAVRQIILDHPRLYRPSPRLWYVAHRLVFPRLPRVYVALAMLACAFQSEKH